jgi:hypothetical protein
MCWNLGVSEMLAMRILIAAIVLSVGVTTACAADLPVDSSSKYSTYAPAIGQRIGQMVIYDYQPGVVVRAYWQSPWRSRHYFPRTGEKPEVGRDEDLSAPRERSRPAETFTRSWSTIALSPPERPRIRAPRTEPSQIPGPLK